MNYRFLPSKGFRRQGQPYGTFETSKQELESEGFESMQEFLLACLAHSSDDIEIDADSIEEYEDAD